MSTQYADMLVTKVHHTGIIVNNMEKSLHFYRDILGCEVIADRTVSGKSIDAIVALKNVQIRIVLLRVGQSDTILELLHYLYPPSKPLPADVKTNDMGIGHIGFTTADMDKTYNELLAKGVKFLSLPQLNPDGKTKTVYFKDTDGNLIELGER